MPDDPFMAFRAGDMVNLTDGIRVFVDRIMRRVVADDLGNIIDTASLVTATIYIVSTGTNGV